MAHIRLSPQFSHKAARTGVCYVSGSGARHSNPLDKTSPLEPVVDLDTWISQEGNLEISMDTARQIADVIGWISPEEYDTLEADVASLTAEVESLEESLESKATALSALAGELTEAVQREADRKASYAPAAKKPAAKKAAPAKKAPGTRKAAS